MEIIDQFTLEQEQKLHPDRINRASTVFKRNPEVRRKALLRSNGHCELCGEPGFLMSNGKLYLETHHIVPLFEGGIDAVSNVAALCPNHHREAHHGHDSANLRRMLQKKKTIQHQ